MCLLELGTILKHCDAARLDQVPHITCTNTADIVNRALAARPATAALAKRTRDSGAPTAFTIPQPPTSVASDAEPVHAGAWRSWYYSVLGLTPGWLMALHHAKHANGEAAREKQEAEITRLYFTNRQEAHARLRGSMLPVSPALTATSLHEFYSDLTTGSVLSIDDAVRYITRGAHHTYTMFLAAARAHQHTGAFWYDLGLRTFCACTTDRCTLECRQGRQPSPGMFNPHHDIRPDYDFSTITVTWILTQMKMDTGAAPLGCPSKWPHCIPPTQHPLLAGFLRWMATHPRQIPDAPLLACLTALPKIPDAAVASKTRGIRCFEPTEWSRLLSSFFAESQSPFSWFLGRCHAC